SVIATEGLWRGAAFNRGVKTQRRQAVRTSYVGATHTGLSNIAPAYGVRTACLRCLRLSSFIQAPQTPSTSLQLKALARCGRPWIPSTQQLRPSKWARPGGWSPAEVRFPWRIRRVSFAG